MGGLEPPPPPPPGYATACRAAWQPKSTLGNSVNAAPRSIIFYIFFTIIAGELFLYVLQCLVMILL